MIFSDKHLFPRKNTGVFTRFINTRLVIKYFLIGQTLLCRCKGNIKMHNNRSPCPLCTCNDNGSMHGVNYRLDNGKA